MTDPIDVVREVLHPVPGPIWQETTATGAVLLHLPTPLRLLEGGGPYWTWEPQYPTALLAGHVPQEPVPRPRKATSAATKLGMTGPDT